ncbi:translocation/assembly module TamB domain-containing protein [Erythrobacter sp. YT30]|uniref:translocation/assembly module TamB domain-containing protein n=1 Tax=Erythrobacter sp. YT30 TaxID=1735012 RepID=UPI00076CD660|nr:translocation/assembly module TamB domain-containing protein [Erythrobacter sp. YT30]KWV92206.1 hypothetical protein AUC45_05535 [Erythrobacter sp. YT30]
MTQESENEGKVSRSWPKRIAIGVLAAIVALVVIVGIALVALNTSSGRGFVKDQIEALEFENGLQIGIGSLEGSLYGDLIIRDFTLSDPQGVFLASPEVSLDWNPFKFISSHIDIEALTAETATFSRVPEFNETPPSDAPLLPDYDIDIDRFEIGELIVAPNVTGTETTANLSGEAHIADRRAEVALDAASEAGDVATLLLDAVPENNRLDLALTVDAPANGVIAAIAGLQEPLSATLKGEGDWAKWDGTLNSTFGGEDLTALTLSARDGTFGAKGDLRLAKFAPDATAQLLGERTLLNLEAALAERSAQVDGQLFSDAFELSTNGLVDLSDNTFDSFKADFRLLEPSTIAPDLRGAGLQALLTLDGKFTRPNLAYDIRAERLNVNDIGMEGIEARGETTVDPANMIVPVSANLARITGLDTAAGGALSDISLDGDVLVRWPRILSDNLRLQSPRIDARVTLLADAGAGRYGGAINGRLDDYRLESVGLFDITSDVDLEATDDGRYALAGAVQARSTRLTNESVRGFLGGDMLVSSDVAYSSDGIARFSNLRLAAPLLKVRDGRGSYSADGQIDLTASGVSSDYGPLGLQLAGTVTNPVATVKAASPGLGIGLADVTATIRGDNNRYAIDLESTTDYGPLTASMLADLSQGPTVFAINEGDLNGIGFTGEMRQSDAGPFVGELNANGRGLTGLVRLGGEGAYQTAAINMRSTGTTLPGPAKLFIGRGIIDANVILYDSPQVAADVQLANASYFGTSIDTLRALIDYRDGTGTAKLVATGENGAPFRVAANAKLEPQLWSAAIKGNVRQVAFETASPARILPREDGYELLPTRLNVGSGSARLAGEFGSSVKLQSRVDGIELRVLNAFSPDLGINGKATGSLDFVQANEGSFPRADARLQLSDLTRTTATSVSKPVDVNVIGQLQASGGAARAVIRQRGSVIGRVNASLAPLGPAAGTWIDRLLDAPLGGGVRYNGPAESVFSLSGQENQELTGALGIAADFSGRVSQPILSGIIRGKNLTYENLAYGTRLSQMAVRGSFDGDELVIEQLDARAGDGTVSASGTVSLAADRGFPMNVDVTLDDARLARSDALSATATGELNFAKREGEKALLSGTLELPETRYRLSYPGAEEVPELSGVRFKPPPANAQSRPSEAEIEIASLLEEIRLDLRLRAGEKLYVSGMGLESEWSADLRISGTSGEPRMAGEVDLIRGTLGFAGRSFELQQGRIRFTGGQTVNPTIAITASESVEEVAVNVNVSGRAYSPQINFSSTPGLPQDEIMSRILFGSSVANLSPLQAVQLAGSLNALRGGSGGLNPLGTLRSATGVDRLRILGSDEATGRGTAVAAGQYITDDIYVEVITDARGFTATQLEISLTPALSVLSQAGGAVGTNVNVRYRKDY